MKTKNIIMKDVSKIVLGVGILLMIPLVAMQFTSEVNWTVSDFIVMGILLFITGVMLDLAWRNVDKYKIPAVLIVLFLFLWLWAELAVGVFTNWGS